MAMWRFEEEESNGDEVTKGYEECSIRIFRGQLGKATDTIDEIDGVTVGTENVPSNLPTLEVTRIYRVYYSS